MLKNLLVRNYGTTQKAAEMLGINHNHMINVISGSKPALKRSGDWVDTVKILVRALDLDPGTIWPECVERYKVFVHRDRMAKTTAALHARVEASKQTIFRTKMRIAADHCETRCPVRAELYTALAEGKRPFEAAVEVLGYQPGQAAGRVRVHQLVAQAMDFDPSTWPRRRISKRSRK